MMPGWNAGPSPVCVAVEKWFPRPPSGAEKGTVEVSEKPSAWGRRREKQLVRENERGEVSRRGDNVNPAGIGSNLLGVMVTMVKDGWSVGG
jgi:hypothetical protein